MPISYGLLRQGQGFQRPTSFGVQPRRQAQPLGQAQPGMGFGGRTGGTGQPTMGFRPQMQKSNYDPAAGSRLSFDPQNPYSFLTGERAASFPGVQSRLIGQAGEQGFLGVNDPRLRDLMRRRILSGGDARRRRAALMAQLAGLDPSQQRSALLDADIEASGQTAGELSDADLQLAMRDQDYARQLLGRSVDYDLGIARMGQEEQRDARFQQRENQGGGFGGFIGQAAGALTGGFLGGYGSERGRRRAGGK